MAIVFIFPPLYLKSFTTDRDQNVQTISVTTANICVLSQYVALLTHFIISQNNCFTPSLNTPLGRNTIFVTNEMLVEIFQRNVCWRKAVESGGGGLKVWRGAEASGFFQTGCFGIGISPAWQEYWIWQPYFCICTQRNSHLQTNTALQTSTCPSTPPCIDPAGLPLCGRGSFWTMIVFPPAPTTHPSILFKLLFSILFSYLLLFYILPTPLFYHIFTLPLFLLPPPSPCLQDNSIINCPGWPILLINSSRWGSLLFFSHCSEDYSPLDHRKQRAPSNPEKVCMGRDCRCWYTHSHKQGGKSKVRDREGLSV